MMSMLRNSMGKRIYKGVLWVTLISIAGTTLIAAIFNRLGGRKAGVIATVNGYKIMDSALQKRKQDIAAEINEIRARLGNYADMFLKMRGFSGKPQEIALQELVQQKLLLSACRASGIYYLSPQFIGEKINDVNFAMSYLSELLPQQVFTGTGQLSQDALKNHLRRNGISIPDFEHRLEELLGIAVFESLLPSAVYSPAIAQKNKQLQEEGERTFSIVTLPLSEYISQQGQVAISDRELQTFFEERNKADHAYWTVEKRSGTVWTFAPSSYGLTATEPELRRFFASHAQLFEKKTFDSVKAQVEEAVTREKFERRFTTEAKHLAQGKVAGEEGAKTFEEFTQKHKASKATLANITRKELGKNPEEATLFEILRAGQLQVLTRDGKGVIVQLDSIVPSAARPFEEVKSQVREDFIKDKARKKLAEDLQKLTLLARTSDTALFDKQVREMKGASVRTVKGLTAGKEEWKVFEKEGLPVQRMKKMVHAGYSIKQMAKDQGFVIVLKEISLPVKSVETQSAIRFPAEDFQLNLQLFSAGFIASLNHSGKIKYNDNVQRQEPLYYEE
ncbi:TPA: hypothetical protein DDZ86_03605 [Candidatus Dependentiae bacterium]|nr:MAG: hypothetical protein UW09_C0003G0073 [candidate division TM6 bacterium GW2011_GWF2_43_87]HBL98701.1 hypothetical protein [Candidatus Dependentiae bacterium]